MYVCIVSQMGRKTVQSSVRSLRQTYPSKCVDRFQESFRYKPANKDPADRGYLGCKPITWEMTDIENR